MPEVVRAVHIKKKMRRIGFKMITLAGTERTAFDISPFFIQEVQVIPEVVEGAFEQIHKGVFLYELKRRAPGRPVCFSLYKNGCGH
jgi:hypothetical protein